VTASVGGGLDVRVVRALAIRVIDVEYRRARLFGQTLTAPRVSAGVVWRLGS
jgi:hypothetical protein